ERIQYRKAMPIDDEINKLEKSYGANADINYRTNIGEDWTFSINQLFFYTYLDNPLLLQNALPDLYQFVNSPGYIHPKGSETNVEIGYDDLKVFWGYTYTATRMRARGRKTDHHLAPTRLITSVMM